MKCYELTFKGTREGLVYARVVLPKSEHKVPVIFHFHGYMGRCWDWADMLAFTVAGYGVVSMDVRGQSGYSQMACARHSEILLRAKSFVVQ